VAKNPRALEQAGASLTAVLRVAGAVRNLGATSWQVADVASGRLDAFCQYGADDVNLLGAVVIAREAGARVTDAAGNPWTLGATSILVSAPQLHAERLAVMPEP